MNGSQAVVLQGKGVEIGEAPEAGQPVGTELQGVEAVKAVESIVW